MPKLAQSAMIRVAMQLDIAVAKTRPSKFLFRGFGFRGFDTHTRPGQARIHESLTFRGLGIRVQAYWVLVKGISLSYHNQETISFTIGPYYGSLN